MNAIDAIINEFDADYQRHLAMPPKLLSQYSELHQKQGEYLSLVCATVFLQYSLMRFLQDGSKQGAVITKVVQSITAFCVERYPDGHHVMQNIIQYMNDYMADAMQHGGQLSVPKNLFVEDRKIIFNKICRPAYPVIDFVVNFAVGDQPKNSFDFCNYIVDTCNRRSDVYKPLFASYCRAFIQDPSIRPSVSNKVTDGKTSSDQALQKGTGCIVPVFVGFSIMFVMYKAMVIVVFG